MVTTKVNPIANQRLIVICIILTQVACSNLNKTADLQNPHYEQDSKIAGNFYYDEAFSISGMQSFNKKVDLNFKTLFPYFDFDDSNEISKANTTVLNSKLERFYQSLQNFTYFSGLYQGNWLTNASSYKVSPAFDKRKGKANFEFDFWNYTSANNESGHISVYGVMYSGDYRDNEIVFDFKMSPYYDYTIDLDNGMIKMEKVKMTLVRSSYLSNAYFQYCQMDVVLQTNLQYVLEQLNSRQEEDYDDSMSDDNKMQLTFLKSGNNSCFTETITIDLMSKSLTDLQIRISNYALVQTAVSLLQIYFFFKQVKQAITFQSVAQTMSVTSLCINLVWTFSYSTIYYQIAQQRSINNSFNLPSFWHTVIFCLQMIFLVLCWQSQQTGVSMNIYRKKLLTFLVIFYIGSTLTMILFRFLIFNEAWFIILNGSIWIPQIIQSYRLRSRNGPRMSFVLTVTLSHIFFPLYLKCCPQSLFERKPDYDFAYIYLGYLLLQILMVDQQQRRNPRFFIPRRFRISSNEFNYFLNFPKEGVKIDIEKVEINQDEDCVICMNPLIVKVKKNKDGSISQCLNSKGEHIRAKQYMKTPCNHRYHIQCLKKWMEVRLECPSCRQAIPVIEE